MPRLRQTRAYRGFDRARQPLCLCLCPRVFCFRRQKRRESAEGEEKTLEQLLPQRWP